MKINAAFQLLSFLLSTAVYSQTDSLKFRHYNNQVTVYSLTGFNASNVAIKQKFGDQKRQRFLFNPPLLLGFGVAYKGIDLSLTRRLPNHLMSSSRYGKSDYFDFKFKFSLARIHWAFRAQKYSSFALLNHQFPDAELQAPHLFLTDFSTFSLNLDARYFFKKEFSYKAAMGFSGEYLSDFFTPYIYGYTGGSNVKHRGNTLLPAYLQDPAASISLSEKVGCFEFGAIPGAAFVKRHNNLQGMLLLGWGPLIQTKWHAGGPSSRAFFGLSSRTDLQLSLGYHKSSWFVQVISEFQFRRINFRQMNVQQYYYDLRIFFGYLIQVKKQPKVITDLEGKGYL
jgi:hypothetical protein